METSKDIKVKLEKIVNYLKTSGCSKILLYGSLAEGVHHINSDIDIAVIGLSSKEFFKAVAVLPFLVKHRVDLVDFGELPPKFQQSIEKNGVVLYAN
ncbi:MAG: nucleotidyltransferase domain-containing protein [Candidatus Aminicenantes bacterium]|nr:MAG: nucleotidyltransferase domain-containing protein [Candidatus Aminicenantes bacterium]